MFGKHIELKCCLIMIILFTFACGSSNSKAKYLEAFEDFVGEVEINAHLYDDEKWEETSSEFEFFTDFQYERFKNELTDEENQKIGELIARYVQCTAKIKSEEFMEHLKEEFEDQKEVVKGFLKGISGKDD